MTTFTFDLEKINSKKDFHIQLAKVLQFPDYYGSNLDAMVDCLRDILDQNSFKTKLTIRMINCSKLLDNSYSKDSSKLDFMNILQALSVIKTEYSNSFEVIVEL